MIVSSQQIGKDWILLSSEGSFTCPECENTDTIFVNSPEGLTPIDVKKVTEDLTNFPTKVIYAVCNVCGMEYTLHLADGKLYAEPSEEEK